MTIVIRCPESSSLYVTKGWTGEDMPNNDTQSDLMVGSTQVRMARETRERASPGSITYVVGTVAYRAALTADSKIEKKSIFTFPASAPVSDFQDMIVHDDYVIVELLNADQF